MEYNFADSTSFPILRVSHLVCSPELVLSKLFNFFVAKFNFSLLVLTDSFATNALFKVLSTST